MSSAENENYFPGEEETDHIDRGKQLRDDEAISSDEDIHEAQAGNTGDTEAKKNELDGPANDLIGQPTLDNDDYDE